MTRPTRRQLLSGLGCSALGSSTLFNTLLHLGGMTSASAQTIDRTDDYRALVCVLLAGGADSFNMLTPLDADAFSEYAGIRADLALSRNDLLPLAGQNGGRSFGVHPAMAEVRDLYDAGRLAFVANVGTLVEPVTLAGIASGAARLPLGLYSHADQIAQWQTALPDSRSPLGWGGRMADLLAARNADPRVSMSISMAGINVFQAGRNSTAFAADPNEDGVRGLFGYDDPDPFFAIRTAAVDSLLNAQYRDLFEHAYATRFRQSVDATQFYYDSLEGVTLQTPFSGSGISQSFRLIARTMAARQRLGVSRQTFFVLFGGWDHHDEVLANQARMLPAVSRAFGELDAALGELALRDRVTTFTTSDFGRTLTSNGRGSDHGWGGNHMVMGGAVQGGRIFGEYPALAAGNPLDTGRGRLIPTLSVDEYFAELALWFGVAPSDLDQVLPNVRRFYVPSAGEPPVGFLT